MANVKILKQRLTKWHERVGGSSQDVCGITGKLTCRWTHTYPMIQHCTVVHLRGGPNTASWYFRSQTPQAKPAHWPLKGPASSYICTVQIASHRQFRTANRIRTKNELTFGVFDSWTAFATCIRVAGAARCWLLFVAVTTCFPTYWATASALMGFSTAIPHSTLFFLEVHHSAATSRNSGSCALHAVMLSCCRLSLQDWGCRAACELWPKWS